jgi:hypothetical protein
LKPLAPAIARLLIRGGAGLLAIAALAFGTGIAAAYIGRASFEPAITTAFILAAVAAVSLNVGMLALAGGLLTGALHSIGTAFKTHHAAKRTP